MAAVLMRTKSLRDTGMAVPHRIRSRLRLPACSNDSRYKHRSFVSPSDVVKSLKISSPLPYCVNGRRRSRPCDASRSPAMAEI